MKIWVKIYLVCMFLCLVGIVLPGIIIIENTYSNSLKNEINNTLKQEKNIKNIFINSYSTEKQIARILTQSKVETDILTDTQIVIKIVNNILNTFKEPELILEIYNEQKNLLTTTNPLNQQIERKELDRALTGKKNYILRQLNDKYLLFVADLIDIQGQKLILVLIKNITFIKNHKKTQYITFILVTLGVLTILALVLPLIIKRITRAIIKVTEKTQQLAQGLYDVRAEVKGKDEVGTLAQQFNKMATEIEDKITKLNEQSADKQRFIENLTHELKNPLTSIIGYTEFLQKTKYNEKIFIDGLNRIHAEGKRILELSNRLLDLIILRNLDKKMKEENLVPLFKDIKHTMKFRLATKNIKLKLQTINTSILMDKELIKVAVINFIDNAYKASEQGSTIILGVQTKNKKKSIYVKDQGEGMSRKEIAKITRPFYRIDNTKSKKQAGAGLGLAICSAIIKLHNARLEVNSRKGAGTTIKIVF